MASSVDHVEGQSSTPSLSSSSQPTSSRGTHLHSFSTSSSASSNSASTSSAHVVRRSLSLLASLPKDFSSLIRSHTASLRNGPPLEAEQRRAASKPFLSEYADMHMFKQDMHLQQTDIFSTENNERLSRKPKSENRLYKFLTRSRSRSRSKPRRSDAVDTSLVPDLPNDPRHARHSSMGQVERQSPSPNRGSKPPSRIQSRPLSSTTTATNTTITPRPKKHRQVINVPSPHSPSSHENDHPTSRPTTPKPSATRKKLHHLFGIPLASPKKSSNSRPSSPPVYRQSPDIPPLPTHDRHGSNHDHDSTPRARRTRSPHSVSPRSQSPSPLSSSKRVQTPTNETPHSNVFRPPKFFSGAGLQASHKHPVPESSRRAGITIHNTAESDGIYSSMTPSPAHASSTVVSGPSSVIPHRRSSSTATKRSPSLTSTHNSRPKDPAHLSPHSSSSPHAHPSDRDRRHAPQTRSTVPKIMHTPATPVRNGTAPARLGHRTDSMDSAYRYRPMAMAVVDEERRGHREKGKGRSTGGEKDKERERELGVQEKEKAVVGKGVAAGGGGVYKRPGTAGGGAARSTKHGSFDFERPGWGGSVARSASGGGSSVAYSYSRSGESLKVGDGSAMAGVGTVVDKSASWRRPQEDKENASAYQVSQRGPTAPLQPDHTGGSASSHATSHTSAGTGGTGLSSSLGRSTGSRVLGAGVAKLAGLSHGLFSFEPPFVSPLPSPTRNTTKAETGSERSVGDHGRGARELEREQEREWEWERVRERERERERERRGRGNERAPIAVPAPVPAGTTVGLGHRSGMKGRSLDLGLGLSWAPTKVREEALLPSSFGRTLSTSRENGAGNGRRRDGDYGYGVEVEREARDKLNIGREVADVFRSALDETGYALFKKYVHRFDAHDIPFDGPTGIVARVERLLENAPSLGEDGKRRVLDDFVQIILQNA